PAHARGIRLVIVSQALLLLGHGLLVRRCVGFVRAALANAACRCADAGSDRRTLAGVASNCAADGANRRAASATADGASGLARRCRVWRCSHLSGWIDAGLLLGPVVTRKLVLLELLLALALLRVDEHFGRGRRRHEDAQHRGSDDVTFDRHGSSFDRQTFSASAESRRPALTGSSCRACCRPDRSARPSWAEARRGTAARTAS